MLFELIAAVVAGIALAGVAMMLRWMSRGWLPKWLVPFAAGAGMLCYSIWSEYTWFDRMMLTMPGSEVAWKNQEQAFWRPWSYIRPVTTRFTALDMPRAKRHPNQPGMVMVDVILTARWQPTTRVTVVYDCNNNKRADLVETAAQVAEDGSLIGATWIGLPTGDPALTTACSGG